MIKERLLALPEEIEEMKMKLLQKQQELIDTKSQLRSWELIEMSYIANELDDNGKPRYSNDVKRNAELQHKKDLSEDYRMMEEAVMLLDNETSMLNIKLDKLVNEQGNLRAICRLEGADNE